ncbi:MAG: esterase [Alistipes sp.]|nr:esterase [Alistipes sp.]
MKHLFLTLCALCATLSLTAQEALWEGPLPLSPEQHADRSVTFRYTAPEAEKVELSGDFAAQPLPMTRNAEGIWEVTTEPLDSELYTYSFMVDGVRVIDPSNVHTVRDIATVSNLFIVAGERGDLYSVLQTPHGTLSKVWYPSPTLGIERRMTIYTPPGYEEGKGRYPVLYLLHGMGGDEEAWPALGRTAQILDNLIAQGKAEKMIVVMTNGNAIQQAAPGHSPKGLYKPQFKLPKTMEGSFEKSFTDVVAYVDKHYRTIAKREKRAIAGLSMGGFHALHISRTMPKTFDYVGLFSAATMRGEGEAFYGDMDQTLAAQRDNGLKLYWIGCGTEDFLWKMNAQFRAKLDQLEFPYHFRESDGGHTWRNWRIYLTEFSQLLFK